MPVYGDAVAWSMYRYAANGRYQTMRPISVVMLAAFVGLTGHLAQAMPKKRSFTVGGEPFDQNKKDDGKYKKKTGGSSVNDLVKDSTTGSGKTGSKHQPSSTGKSQSKRKIESDRSVVNHSNNERDDESIIARFTVPHGTSSFFANYGNKGKATYLFSNGDLNQIGQYGEVLRAAGFAIENDSSGSFPGVRTETEYVRGLKYLFEHRVEGWWNLPLVDYGITTKEKFSRALDKSIASKSPRDRLFQ